MQLLPSGQGVSEIFEEYIERLKCRVAALEKMRKQDPDIIMLKKQVHDLKLENERLQRALNEVSACPSVCLSFQFG